MTEQFDFVKFSDDKQPVPRAVQDLKISHQGFLYKEGGGYKSWKKRFFVLSGNGLYYYEHEDSKSQKGVVVLKQDSYVETEFQTNTKKPEKTNVFNKVFKLVNSNMVNENTFGIHSEERDAEGLMTNRLLIVTSETKEEKKAWIEAIEKAIEESKCHAVKTMFNDECKVKITYSKFVEPHVNNPEFMKSYFGKHLGTMAFDGIPIPMECSIYSKFKDTIILGDDIYARFSFLHALKNYPNIDIYNGINSSLPISLKEKGVDTHNILIQIFLSVDGEFLSTPGEPFKYGFTHIQCEQSVDREHDIYGCLQCIDFPIYTNTPQDDENFEKSRQFFESELSKLSVGKHHVKVVAAFSIIPTEANYNNVLAELGHKYPYTMTYPIKLSEGEFTLIQNKLDIEELSKPDDENSELISQLFDYFNNSMEYGRRFDRKEEVFHISITHSWEKWPDSDKQFVDFAILSYRNPSNGWIKETVLLSRAYAFTESNPQEPYKIDSVNRYAMSSYNKDIDKLFGTFVEKIPHRWIAREHPEHQNDIFKYRQSYDTIDTNGKGGISIDELYSLFDYCMVPRDLGFIFYNIYKTNETGLTFEDFFQIRDFCNNIDNDPTMVFCQVFCNYVGEDNMYSKEDVYERVIAIDRRLEKCKPKFMELFDGIKFSSKIDDQWNNIYSMVYCIISLMEYDKFLEPENKD